MAYQSPTESPPPQRGPEGFVLTVSHSQHYAGVYLCAFGFIGTAFSTFMLMAVLREPFGFFGLFYDLDSFLWWSLFNSIARYPETSFSTAFICFTRRASVTSSSIRCSL